ncbi:hypothetical protein ACOSZC_02445 [Marinobacter salsuginis]
MFSELVTSVKATLYDRITSPLSGAFLVSALLINYKTVFLLFDGQNYYLKIHYLEAALYPDWLVVLLKLFVIPAFSAIVFIFLYPIPSRLAYENWLGQQKKLKEIKVKIEGETPLTREESRELRRQLRAMEDRRDAELSEKESEIDALKKDIAALEEERSKYNDEFESEVEKRLKNWSSQQIESSNSASNNTDGKALTEIESDIDFKVAQIDSDKNIAAFISFVADSSTGAVPIRFMDETGLSAIRAETIAHDLVDLGLGEVYRDGDGDEVFTLSREGKRFALRHGYA